MSPSLLKPSVQRSPHHAFSFKGWDDHIVIRQPYGLTLRKLKAGHDSLGKQQGCKTMPFDLTQKYQESKASFFLTEMLTQRSSNSPLKKWSKACLPLQCRVCRLRVRQVLWASKVWATVDLLFTASMLSRFSSSCRCGLQAFLSLLWIGSAYYKHHSWEHTGHLGSSQRMNTMSASWELVNWIH